MSDQAPTVPLHATAAGGAAVLAGTIAVVVSAPAIARPLVPALILLVAVTFVVGVVLGFLAKLPFRKSPGAGRFAIGVAAVLAASPWLLASGSSMARVPLMLFVGTALAVAVGMALASRKRTGAIHAILTAVVLIAVRGSSAFDLPDDKVRPVLVFGIDAGTWEQMDPMIERGELPNLERIREIGATATLKSEHPSMSPRVWTTLATGAPPAEHGIVDFGRTRKNLLKGRVWDAAHEAGAKIGLMEWHMTWPPDEYAGFTVPAWLARGPDTIPAEASFLKRLQEAGGESASPLSLVLGGDGFSAIAVSSAGHLLQSSLDIGKIFLKRYRGKDARWRLRIIQARLKTDLYFELMARENPEFSALVLYIVDGLGHTYWKWHEPELYDDVTDREIEARGDAIRRAYIETDDALGLVLDRLDLENTTLVIFSDHGMESDRKRGEVRSARLSPPKLLATLGVQKEELNYAFVGQKVHFTSAAMPPDTALLRRIHTAMAEARIEELPDGDGPFILEPFDPAADTLTIHFRPSLLGAADNHLDLGGTSVVVGDLFRPVEKTGVHTLDGIVMLAGPGIAAGGTFDDADIYDIAPTLLYAMGLQVPEALQGRVLAEAWTEAWRSEHPIESRAGGLPDPPLARDLEEDDRSLEQVDGHMSELGYTGDDEDEEEPESDPDVDPDAGL